MTQVSATVPDWSREHKVAGEWNPGKSLLASIRDYQRNQHQTNLFARFRKKSAVLRHRFWSAVSGADIPLNCQIGGGLLLPHPNGVVIHPAAVIGPNCLLFQQVTLGTRGKGGAPVLGGHVDVGAGARLLGAITLGHHAVVGANAVVVCHVPTEHMAIGVPAVLKPINRKVSS